MSEEYIRKLYHIFLNNYFRSIKLTKMFLKRKTYGCGSAWEVRKVYSESQKIWNWKKDDPWKLQWEGVVAIVCLENHDMLLPTNSSLIDETVSKKIGKSGHKVNIPCSPM